jgi:tRNA threonylcarbamoyladenosine biosynthesis protein TsaE
LNIRFDNIRLEELESVVSSLGDIIKTRRLFLFSGEQGSGKTTLIKTFIEYYFGKADDFSSPTYALMNIYSCNGKEIYHMDWYRIEHEEELEEAGISEIVRDMRKICFVEWPEAGRYLWEDLPHVHFNFNRHADLLNISVRVHGG